MSSRYPLEHWEAASGKWVLYRSQAQHTADCERYPFEDIPKRIFLDTNVLNLLVKHSEQIFEHAPIPENFDRTRAWNIQALMHIFAVGARAAWDIVTSPKSLSEIDQTPDAEIRKMLLDYAVELVAPMDEEARHAASLGQWLVDAPFMAHLRDPNDRELIGNAIGLGCDVFCTCDERTIIRKRDRVQLPLRIMTPIEWWKHMKPWGGLWL